MISRDNKRGNRPEGRGSSLTNSRPERRPSAHKENSGEEKKAPEKKFFRKPDATTVHRSRRPAIKHADDGSIRLNRFLANAGICSRREADTLIEAGVVRINGKVVTELGSKVMPDDTVYFHDQLIKSQKKIYILLNKPKNCVTTVVDPHGRTTVLDIIAGACKERVYPVGRLDRNTMGVLLLTNDGELTTKLTHPKYEKKKIYEVTLDKPLDAEHYDALLKGIVLEDGPINADALEYLPDTKRMSLGIEIHSGRNRIVRRMFEHFGYTVEKLDRVYFAGLTKYKLPRGHWRFLTDEEVGMLKMGSYE